jgi:hypothetical protein
MSSPSTPSPNAAAHAEDDARAAPVLAWLAALLDGSADGAAREGDAPEVPGDDARDAPAAVGEAASVVRRLRRAVPHAAWTIETVTRRDDLLLCHALMTGAPAPLRAVFVARLHALADAHAVPACWCAIDEGALRRAQEGAPPS